jgi:putative DNA primase/helicase
MSGAIAAARGRWPDLLQHLAGLTPEQLTDRHQPCPCCGGADRYRFDDLDGSGSWFCNQCGGRDGAGGGGSGVDLLMRLTGWSYRDACSRIEQHLGVTADPDIPPPPTKGAEHVWQYNATFYVCRFPGKSIRPLSWDGTAWRWKAPPAPRPLYGLERLRANPDAGVLIVEGEKAADAAAQLFPSGVAITWPSGCKAAGKADWTPVAGRAVTLWPDADDVGRDAMVKLAPKLLQAGARQVRIVTPPADVPDGWDLADADWSSEQALSYLAANRSAPIVLPGRKTDETEPIEPEIVAPERLPEVSDHFLCLGFDGDGYYYQPRSTGQVVRIGRGSHTGTNLCALAPLQFWQSIHGNKTSVDWVAAASGCFARQAAVGVYSPDRIRGRGAWWDHGRAVLHLGDRLSVDGIEQPITSRLPGSPYLYQRLAAIDGLDGITPLSDEESYPLMDIATRFHWEVPASGLLLAGWTVLAPICGALDWRPHAWLTASAGSGKSAILDRYVGPLLGPIALWPEGNTTEAFIRQELRADALPVVFDEAESNEKADQQRIQSILSLARVASSSGRGVIGKGSADGSSQRFVIRSMFLLASIATALKQGADKSRFAQLTLRNPTELPKHERKAHWQSLDRDLDNIVTEATGRRLLMRTIGLIPVIRQSIAVFRRVAADRFDSQRLGDQYGSLLAGAWSLYSSEVPTDAQALELINQNDWEPYSQATEVPDERRCIQRILQHQVRVESNDRVCTRTLGELAEIVARHRSDREVEPSQAEAAMGRHGLKVDADQKALLVSNTAEAVAAILRDTAWAHSWSTVLCRLQGATKTGPVRFGGAGGVSRAVALQMADL